MNILSMDLGLAPHVELLSGVGWIKFNQEASRYDQQDNHQTTIMLD